MPDRNDDLDPALLRRLTNYEADFHAGQPPETGAVARTGRRWLPAFAIGGVAVAAGALGAALLVNGPRSDVADVPQSPTPSVTPSPSPSIEAPPTTIPTPSTAPSTSHTAVSTPSPTAEPSDPPPATTWELRRMDLAAYWSGVRWYEETGWIAFGTTESQQPVVATSRDGGSWTAASLPAGVSGYTVTDAERAVVNNRAVLLVAVVNGDPGSTSILYSNDGRSWQRAVTPDTATEIMSIAHGPLGFVATGWVTDYATFESSGRVWRSSDGLNWTESAPTVFKDALPERIEVIGGRYIAFGRPDRASPPATAWTSTDAVSWDPREILPSSGVGSSSVVGDADGDTATFAGTKDDSYAATSLDGTSWDVTAVDEGTPASLTGIDVIGEATILTGYLDIADGPADTLIWVRDAPGAPWRFVDWREHLPGVAENDVDVRRAVFVAAGPDRSLLLVADGTILLTSARLP